MSLLAQFDVPSEGLSSSYYSPLILLGRALRGAVRASRALRRAAATAGPRRVPDAGFVTLLPGRRLRG